MTYEESPALEPDNLLPANLEAKILYHLPSLTKNGQQQAKCVYLHEGIEYQGIIFSEGNETWFKNIEPGTVINAEGIRPSKYSQYAGQYLGRVSALNSQLNLQSRSVTEKIYNIQGSEEPYFSYLVRLLREAADIIEDAFPKVPKLDKVEKVVVKTETPIKLKYKRSDEWETIIKKIIMKSDSLRTKPFSGISLNAYIDASYTDWEEGDLEMLTNALRWKTMVGVALANLLQCNFVEREPGTKKHYRVTQDALDSYFQEISLN